MISHNGTTGDIFPAALLVETEAYASNPILFSHFNYKTETVHQYNPIDNGDHQNLLWILEEFVGTPNIRASTVIMRLFPEEEYPPPQW